MFPTTKARSVCHESDAMKTRLNKYLTNHGIMRYLNFIEYKVTKEVLSAKYIITTFPQKNNKAV